MTTYYGFDHQYIYTHPVEFDPYGPIPENTVDVAPPEFTFPQAVQWQGAAGWVVLDERPAYEAPVIIEPVVEMPPMEKIDFLRLFTQSERIAIKEEAKTNPVVEDYQYMVDNSTMILLSDPDIETGIPILESLGLIADGRAAQILSGVRP